MQRPPRTCKKTISTHLKSPRPLQGSLFHLKPLSKPLYSARIHRTPSRMPGSPCRIPWTSPLKDPWNPSKNLGISQEPWETTVNIHTSSSLLSLEIINIAHSLLNPLNTSAWQWGWERQHTKTERQKDGWKSPLRHIWLEGAADWNWGFRMIKSSDRTFIKLSSGSKTPTEGLQRPSCSSVKPYRRVWLTTVWHVLRSCVLVSGIQNCGRNDPTRVFFSPEVV